MSITKGGEYNSWWEMSITMGGEYNRWWEMSITAAKAANVLHVGLSLYIPLPADVMSPLERKCVFIYLKMT